MPSPLSPEQQAAVTRSLEQQDPITLAGALDEDQITRLELAEKVLELEHNRRKRTSRLGNIVSVVAFGGLLVNAFQSYMSSQSQQHLREADQRRWEKEFDRAKQADRYNAFLATSALATDSSNSDKRLVGYALLQEFVGDKDYNSKTTLMLEQALFDELDRDTTEGLSEEHRNSVTAILSALSETTDCGALAAAVRSIGRISKRHAKTGDLAEAQEVFALYVRKLYGRAALACKTPDDFAGVERPLRETLVKAPEIGSLKGKVTPALATHRLAEMLKEECEAELQISSISDCPELLRGYDHLCAVGKAVRDGVEACQVIHQAVETLPPPVPPRAEAKAEPATDGR